MARYFLVCYVSPDEETTAYFDVVEKSALVCAESEILAKHAKCLWNDQFYDVHIMEQFCDHSIAEVAVKYIVEKVDRFRKAAAPIGLCAACFLAKHPHQGVDCAGGKEWSAHTSQVDASLKYPKVVEPCIRSHGKPIPAPDDRPSIAPHPATLMTQLRQSQRELITVKAVLREHKELMEAGFRAARDNDNKLSISMSEQTSVLNRICELMVTRSQNKAQHSPQASVPIPESSQLQGHPGPSYGVMSDASLCSTSSSSSCMESGRLFAETQLLLSPTTSTPSNHMGIAIAEATPFQPDTSDGELSSDEEAVSVASSVSHACSPRCYRLTDSKSHIPKSPNDCLAIGNRVSPNTYTLSADYYDKYLKAKSFGCKVKMTRKLLPVFFDRDELAASSATGSPRKGASGVFKNGLYAG